MMSELTYVTMWRNKWITAGAKSIDDFIKTFEGLAKMFRQWKEWGVTLLEDENLGDNFARFVTKDKEVAIKAQFAYKSSEGTFLETLSGEDVRISDERFVS